MKIKKTKIVITRHNGGRLCNQLWNFANMYAYCLENGYELYNPSFIDYQSHFEHLEKNTYFSLTNPTYLPVFNKIAQKLFTIKHKAKRLLPGATIIDSFNYTNIPITSKIDYKKSTSFSPFPLIADHQEDHPIYLVRYVEKIHRHILKLNVLDTDFDHSSPHFLEKKLSPETYYFIGWCYNAYEAIHKHRNEITEKFKPNNIHQKNIDTFWESNINPKNVIIGVHIRHNDFRDFIHGNFYHPISDYKVYMKNLMEQFSDLNFTFLIFSDEKRSLDEFSEFNNVIVANGDFIEDLYTMAKCDFLIGTYASTFLQWASWYGDIPALNMSLDTTESNEQIHHIMYNNTHSKQTNSIDWDSIGTQIRNKKALNSHV